MLKVIESMSKDTVRLKPAKNIKLQVGLIGQLIEVDGIPNCTISDGSRPFGIISKIKGPFGMVSILLDTMILRTDKYEKQDGKYKFGNPLYVSNKGKLTIKKNNDASITVGYVISGPNSNQKYIELNWI